MKKLCLVLLAAAVLLSACVSRSGSAPLVGDWKLTAYGPVDSPQEAVPGIEAILTFEVRDRVSGNLGCNQFGGGYKIKGDQITFDEMASTLMACSEPQMQQEQAAFTIMAGSANYKIESSTLTITKDNQVLFFEAVAGD